ncbi:uncharacterized protein LOC107846353 [Capsicum annuum]|uniref:uncharacterized protein LOC107846353 n=1 Tax=Capsicum annuum TaxID=4072 RepID=UPI001FB0A856|nr:uncharacterized protein LOC107846353 [Capsicum annuum]
MKDIMKKERAVSYEPVDNLHHYSVISIRSLVQKKTDLEAFTIPCTIGSLEFSKGLCDLEAGINLMSLSFFEMLGLGDPTPTNMIIVMKDRSVKKPIGMPNDILIRVANFIFPADFVILDCEVEFEVPIIFGGPFLAIGRVIVDMELNELPV